ncbi:MULTISPECIES: hypothetical protein [unclassified Methanoregula]|uniref:hypothetical protein n=1 Tax=unclassified Methanoregula TaxID=2649730 RepID=UPI0009CB46BC|nr:MULTISPECIES: hypothetical protein [unclassified Methanoregula]OPX62890.1 MAG: hypothetical protein A4E33_02019 [Methanoregula sp. PtaB.Bin085]OPY35327.1 MAG: hypothetical protein A4E34_00855 [Methanoregula sp. PtaU1.Bin006]
MKPSSLAVLFLVLIAAACASGCSSSGQKAESPQQAAPVTTSPPASITYEKHGISFVYPGNLVLTERDASDAGSGSFEDGEIWLRGAGPDNLTINWIAMHHRPPDIPAVYEAMRKSFQNDKSISDLRYFLLETYPQTTCGDATLIGHMSFVRKGQQVTTNEGILLWYHAKQDRTYIIDLASADDYKTGLRDALGRYQQSFRCTDS